MSTQSLNKIVFYDGECGLCQRSISIINHWDKNKKLLFAPLNGETYKQLFNETNDMSTVVFYVDGHLFMKSDAIIEIGRQLGGVKLSFLLLKLVPKFIRDFFYLLIARHRSKVSCIILVKDHRFLR